MDELPKDDFERLIRAEETIKASKRDIENLFSQTRESKSEIEALKQSRQRMQASISEIQRLRKEDREGIQNQILQSQEVLLAAISSKPKRGKLAETLDLILKGSAVIGVLFLVVSVVIVLLWNNGIHLPINPPKGGTP